MAKYSGSLIDGALNATPILILYISSSLINNVDAVKWGYSELTGDYYEVDNPLKAF